MPLIIGKIRSSTAISFENLVKILPIGFESKNKIFDLISFSTTLVCKLVVLFYKTKMMTHYLMKLRAI